MTAMTTVLFTVKVSLALTVFAIGLSARTGDVAWLTRHPALLARSIVSMNVILPILAVSVAVGFALNPAVRVALVALAISPMPPILPRRMISAGGHSSYAVSLLVLSGLTAVVTVPVSVWAVGALLASPLHVAPPAIAALVLKSVLLPLLAGLGIRRYAPAVAKRFARDITLVATIVLVVALIPVFIKVLPVHRTLIGDGTLIAIAVMTCIALAVGHLLGGPLEEGRPVLALATASRHPAIAIAIAQATVPDNPLVPAAVLLELIVVAVISIPYTMWVKRSLERTIVVPAIEFSERRRPARAVASHRPKERRAPLQRYDRG